jgi:hypothetical protein
MSDVNEARQMNGNKTSAKAVSTTADKMPQRFSTFPLMLMCRPLPTGWSRPCTSVSNTGAGTGTGTAAAPAPLMAVAVRGLALLGSRSLAACTLLAAAKPISRNEHVRSTRHSTRTAAKATEQACARIPDDGVEQRLGAVVTRRLWTALQSLR